MSLLRIYVHAVWSVKYRDAVLTKAMRPTLIDSMHRLLVSHGHTPVISNYEPDHVHCLFKYAADKQTLSDLMQAVKGGASKTLNEYFFTSDKPFRWQKGYGAFSVCPSHVQGKAQYVRDQEMIHAHRRWEQEFADLLDEHPPCDLDEDAETEGERAVRYFEGLVER